MIDDPVAVSIELVPKRLFRDSHAHGVADALSERAGGGFDTGCVTVFRVSRGLGVELTELLQVLDGQVVTGQMQQGIDQHGAVAVGQHETIAIRPIRIARVMLHIIVPEHLGDVGHAHGRARVPGFGFLHGIHTQRTNGVGDFSA